VGSHRLVFAEILSIAPRHNPAAGVKFQREQESNDESIGVVQIKQTLARTDDMAGLTTQGIGN
jgi:hypothetical protein